MKTRIRELLLVTGVVLISSSLFATSISHSIIDGTGAVNISTLVGTFPSGGENITITGPSNSALTNGWINIDRNISIGGGTFKIGSGGIVKSVGAYDLNTNYLTVSNSQNANQGVSTLLLQGLGNDSSERFIINHSNMFAIGGDTNIGSSSVNLAGYVTLTSANNQRLDIGNVANSTAYSKLLISGQSNILNLYSINVGNQTNNSTRAGNSIFEIKGSTHSINIKGALRVTAGLGTSTDDIIGGAVSFIADANGISTINVASGALAAQLTGVITLDLSDFIFTGASDDFQLISTTNAAMISAISTWVDAVNGGTDKFAVYYGGTKLDKGDWVLSAENDGLWVSVNQIPESSTCAVILGALALMFVVYRRCK